jgi:hypothetical protein
MPDLDVPGVVGRGTCTGEIVGRIPKTEGRAGERRLSVILDAGLLIRDLGTAGNLRDGDRSEVVRLAES